MDRGRQSRPPRKGHSRRRVIGIERRSRGGPAIAAAPPTRDQPPARPASKPEWSAIAPNSSGPLSADVGAGLGDAGGRRRSVAVGSHHAEVEQAGPGPRRHETQRPGEAGRRSTAPSGQEGEGAGAEQQHQGDDAQVAAVAPVGLDAGQRRTVIAGQGADGEQPAGAAPRRARRRRRPSTRNDPRVPPAAAPSRCPPPASPSRPMGRHCPGGRRPSAGAAPPVAESARSSRPAAVARAAAATNAHRQPTVRAMAGTASAASSVENGIAACLTAKAKPCRLAGPPGR